MNEELEGLRQKATDFIEQEAYEMAIPILHKLAQCVGIASDRSESEFLFSCNVDISACYYDLGEVEQAIRYALVALEIGESINAPNLDIWLGNIAVYHLELEDLDTASLYFRKALKLSKGTNRSQFLINLADIWHQQSRNMDAIRLLQDHLDSLATLSTTSSRSDLTAIYMRLGHLCQVEGRQEEVLMHYQKALEFDEGDQCFEIQSLIAQAHLTFGNLESAIETLNNCLLHYEQENDIDNQVFTLFSLANIYADQNNIELALSFYEQVLGFEKKDLDPYVRAETHLFIGRLKQESLLFQEAQHYYDLALEFSKDHDFPDVAMKAMVNLSPILRRRKQFELALKYAREALQIAEELGELEFFHYTHNNLAVCLKQRAQWKESLQHFQSALEYIELDPFSEPAERIVQFNSIGALYLEWGDLDYSLHFFEKAADLSREIEDRELMATCESNVGIVEMQQGKEDLAFRRFQAALSIREALPDKERQVSSLIDLGLYYDHMLDHETAISYYLQAKELSDSMQYFPWQSTLLNNIGVACATDGNQEKALQYYERALEIDRKNEEFDFVAVDLNNIALTLCNLKRFKEALAYLTEAVEIKERLRQQASADLERSYLSRELITYNLLIRVYIGLNMTPEAIETAEKSRAQQLTERLRLSKKGPFGLNLNALQNSLGSRSKILYYIVHQDGLAVFVVSDKEITVREIDRTVALDHLLEIWDDKMGKDKGISAAAESFSAGDRFSKQTLEKQRFVRDFDKLIQFYQERLKLDYRLWSGKRNLTEKLAKNLYDLLLLPLQLDFDQIDDLLIIPDGVLALLPFETLIDQHQNYLIEKATVAYASSLTAHQILESRRQSNLKNPDSLLAVGGIDYYAVPQEAEPITRASEFRSLKIQLESDSLQSTGLQERMERAFSSLGIKYWPELKFAKQEIENVAVYSKNSRMLTGGAASRQDLLELSVRNELRASILHFACHGISVAGIPRLSALVLAHRSGAANAYLNSEDVASLQIDSQLVVLSACESGFGTVFYGEGMVSLAQAFLVAGAQSVMASLWKVNDEGTASLMQEFYRLVFEAKHRYPKALQVLKINCIEGVYGSKYQNPIFWASWLLHH